jgi:ABC-type nitrate/sulfonate/bicarbonate transport system substrate-binding protein
MTTSSHRGSVRRGLLLSVFASVAALVLAACGSSSSSDSGSSASGDFGKLTVQLSWIKNAEFAGEFMADSKGYFKKAGFDPVVLNAGPGATESIVLSGKADFGLSNAVTTGQVVAKEDAPLKIVGTTYQKNPFTILSLKKGANITKPSDLIGKKIGVQAGGNETLFDALLKVNGIKPDQVTKVPVQYDPKPLITGQVDGFLAYVTNESILVQSQGHPVSNLLFADNGLPFVAESVITTDDMIKKDPAKVKAFLKAEIQGWKDAVKAPAAGATLAVTDYGKSLKLDQKKETQQAQIQSSTLVQTPETKANGLFTVSDKLMAQNMATLKAAGIDLKADDLFDMSLLKQLYKDDPSLKG